MKQMKDSLGDRMKDYENRTRISLMRRTYTVIRIDGKAFHSYTIGFNKPFDDDLMEDMDNTALFLCQNITGTKLAYVQSDEISLLVTDFDTEKTEAWFDNNLQKLCSISASLATAEFNKLRIERYLWTNENTDGFSLANFDSRAFQLPTKMEAENYLIWRQEDCTRNSIQMTAQSLYKHKELDKKNTNEMKDMIFKKGQNWNDYPSRCKRGRMVSKENCQKAICTLEDKEKIKQVKKSNTNWYSDNVRNEFGVETKSWKIIDVPIFTKNREFLSNRIPNNL